MKQIDITNKNKDLDLRRFGKGVYTKKGGNGEGGNSGGGSDDSENDEELNAFMEFFDGLDDSYKKLPYVASMNVYNEQPLPEQNELFGNKDTASDALIFIGGEDDNSPIAAFVSDDLCKKLVGWCFNYYGNDTDEIDAGFSPIPLYAEGKPFLVADKLPLLVEKCMVQDEITGDSTEARFVYILGKTDIPLNYIYTKFLANSSDDSSAIIIKFEDNGKTYYAPGLLLNSPEYDG